MRCNFHPTGNPQRDGATVSFRTFRSRPGALARPATLQDSKVASFLGPTISSHEIAVPSEPTITPANCGNPVVEGFVTSVLRRNFLLECPPVLSSPEDADPRRAAACLPHPHGCGTRATAGKPSPAVPPRPPELRSAQSDGHLLRSSP